MDVLVVVVVISVIVPMSSGIVMGMINTKPMVDVNM